MTRGAFEICSGGYSRWLGIIPFQRRYCRQVLYKHERRIKPYHQSRYGRALLLQEMRGGRLTKLVRVFDISKVVYTSDIEYAMFEPQQKRANVCFSKARES